MNMRRISSGFFSAAYTSSDPNYIILFSIDPLKETMYEFVQTYSSVHFPKITKIGDEDKYGELISIYRIERLVQLIDAESNNMSWQRQQVMKTFSDLYSKLFYANYVNGRFQLKTTNRQNIQSLQITHDRTIETIFRIADNFVFIQTTQVIDIFINCQKICKHKLFL